MTNPDLAALSAAATQALNELKAKPGDGALIDAYIKASGVYHATLEHLYRAGRLVHIDEGMREATARAEAADEIERLTAQLAEARESERAATEREAQTKLDGVRAGIKASAGACEAAVNTIPPGKIMERMACGLCFNNIRALDPEAIAKGEG